MPLNEELKKLIEPSIESSVYIALLHPKTQAEVIEAVYSKKKTTRTVVYAMHNLAKAKYIESLNPPVKIENIVKGERVESTKKHRKNEKFCSNLSPFVEYAKDRYIKTIADYICSQKSYIPEYYKRGYRKKIINSGLIRGLSNEEASALNKVVSSQWFRSFLDMKVIDTIDYPLTNLNMVPLQWTSYRDDKGILRFSIVKDAVFVDRFDRVKIGAMQLLGYLFKDITMKLTVPFLELPALYKKMPKVEDLNRTTQSFDGFANSWVNKNFNKENRDFIIKSIKTSGNLITSEYDVPEIRSKISTSTSKNGEPIFSEKVISKSIKHIKTMLVSKEEIDIRLRYAKNFYFLCIPRELAIKVVSSMFKTTNQYTSVGIEVLIKEQSKYLKYLNAD